MSADFTHRGDEILTTEERAAIRSLGRLAKSWPDTLMLFSASGSLCVFRSDDSQVADGAIGMDQEKVVAHIQGIPNDGGDW